MSGIDVGEELGARAAQARALALLRIRSRALAVVITPAAVAVVLFAAGAQGHLGGPVWDGVRWAVAGVAVVVLLVAAAVAVSVARARPAVSPTVPVAEEGAPDLYRLVRDLADRLGVPAPSAIALTPDCDSWLEDRTHRAPRTPRAHRKRPKVSPGAPSGAAARSGTSGAGTPSGTAGAGAGTPSGTAGAGAAAPPEAHGRAAGEKAPAPVLVIGSPFLWWMRVAELRAVLAPVVAGTGSAAHPDISAARRFVRGLDAAVADAAAPGKGPLRAAPAAFTGWVARLLLRACREHAAEMERCVAVTASMRAQDVDYALRIAAQEQVGLAYAGWDRLLTRVALPAWRMGRWPSRLDAGVVSALTELSRRDRLADGFTSRLGERPACDLLEEPGVADEATSLLAARLFHGGPAESGPDWAPVDWQQYPEEVVDRKWRTEAARLHRVLDAMGVPPASAADPAVPTLARVMEHLAGPGEPGEELAAGIGAAVARDDARAPAPGPAPQPAAGAGAGADALDVWGPDPLPLFPLQPPRTGTELLADHVAAMVCCAAVDTAGAAPGLDWLDGPALLVDGERRADLVTPVLSLVEDGDPDPLRSWLAEVGVRSDKPVRLV
ncbi:hypothetical protein ACFTWM_29110 [Streptomyces bacillaris]|uniref:Uncharacterized protein n=1 Tax=Streptomyces cavourensis TaxID=67258 RepID=A0AAD0Q6Q7_9ACTN|nr:MULTISPECIES: hypothetical protein [Streptomyces]AXI72879.1 hypothetical protein DTW94_17585 [Streptomyces cavourensis]NUV44907.1 hypothetical protein [Streptomyces sp. CAI-24]